MNLAQKVTSVFGLVVIAGAPLNAAPPESISGLVLGASIQEVKDKYGSQVRRAPKWKEDLAASRCGIDRYEIDLPEFSDEEIFFYQGKLFTIRMKMKAVLTAPEIHALAKRFVAKYGVPEYFLCAYSNEPVIKIYSLNNCELKPTIDLTYESGPEGSAERNDFYINIYSTEYSLSAFRGYELNLMKGWRYYHDITEACRKRALRAIDEENAKRITLPD